jgi:ferric-dicitrate binding protein FerR (iron transport regulator)
MSKERARARAAREAERAAERDRAAKKRARQDRLEALKPSLPELPRRRRRYGALPLRVLLGLAFGWLVTQWVFWQVVTDVRTRIGLGLVSLLALPLDEVLLPMKGRR